MKLSICLSVLSSVSLTAARIDLGAAALFAVLGQSTVTNTGPSVVNGNIGTGGPSMTGFPPGVVVGSQSLSLSGVAVFADVTEAYNSVAALTGGAFLTGDLAGLALLPGTYTYSSSAFLTGILTLQGTGLSTDAWYFQIGSTLITSAESTVVMTGGGLPCNVFWQVGSSATFQIGTAFQGTVLASDSITMATGATFNGGLFALSGAVTMDTNIVIAENCPPVTSSTSTSISATSSSTASATTTSTAPELTSTQTSSEQDSSSSSSTSPVATNISATANTPTTSPSSTSLTSTSSSSSSNPYPSSITPTTSLQTTTTAATTSSSNAPPKLPNPAPSVSGTDCPNVVTRVVYKTSSICAVTRVQTSTTTRTLTLTRTTTLTSRTTETSRTTQTAYTTETAHTTQTAHETLTSSVTETSYTTKTATVTIFTVSTHISLERSTSTVYQTKTRTTGSPPMCTSAVALVPRSIELALSEGCGAPEPLAVKRRAASAGWVGRRMNWD